MNNTYLRKLGMILLFLAAASSSGCATLAPLLDTATDPRLLEIIGVLRTLIHDYQLRLNNPLLEAHTKHDTEGHFQDLAAKIEVQLQELEKIGYAKRAARWRAKLDLPPNGHS